MAGWGLPLEKRIQTTNDTYRARRMALIEKRPTPWNVSYNKKTGRVYKAFPVKKSTVDFDGISNGRFIAFEAKSTILRTRFDLKNIELHQITYLQDALDQGGITFFLIEFAKFGEVFFVPFVDIKPLWEAASFGSGKKSLPKAWFDMNCAMVKPGRGVTLDYLKYCNVEGAV